MSRTPLIISIVGFLVISGFAIATLTWLRDLKEKYCECAEHANTQFIQFMCYYVIVMAIIGFILSMFVMRGFVVRGRIMSIIKTMSLINFGLIIAFIVIGLKYVKTLHDRKCACALNDPRRTVFQVWMWMYVAIYAYMVVALLFVFILLATLLARAKN